MLNTWICKYLTIWESELQNKSETPTSARRLRSISTRFASFFFLPALQYHRRNQLLSVPVPHSEVPGGGDETRLIVRGRKAGSKTARSSHKKGYFCFLRC